MIETISKEGRSAESKRRRNRASKEFNEKAERTIKRLMIDQNIKSSKQ